MPGRNFVPKWKKSNRGLIAKPEIASILRHQPPGENREPLVQTFFKVAPPIEQSLADGATRLWAIVGAVQSSLNLVPRPQHPVPDIF
jgi:hypothetical protein